MTAEVDWRMTWTPTLSAMPWRHLQCCEGFDGQLLMKSRFEDNTYEVLVTDLTSVWSEKLTEKDIKDRMSSLNPNIEGPMETIMDHIQSNIEEVSEGTKYKVSFVRSLIGCSQALLMTLSSQLSGLPFLWKINGEPAPNVLFVEHVTQPLLMMVSELGRRQQELFNVLHNKDKEIEDYKMQGYKTSRRHIETASFDEISFLDTTGLSKNFEDTVQRKGTGVFDAFSRDLYRQIMTKQAWLHKPAAPEIKPLLSDEEGLLHNSSIEREPSGPSFDNKRMPPSLLDLDLGMGVVRDNRKRKPPREEVQEMGRREALNRRLAEEQDRKHDERKKRKKNIF